MRFASFIVALSACAAQHSPVVLPSPAESIPPMETVLVELDADQSTIRCLATGTELPVPAGATATSVGRKEVVFADSATALVVKTGRAAALPRDVLADWKQLFQLIVPDLPSHTTLAVRIHIKGGSLLRLSGEVRDSRSNHYRLTSILVSRNGASCRIQALERAPWDARSAVVASLDDVRDLPAFDLGFQPRSNDADWGPLLRVIAHLIARS